MDEIKRLELLESMSHRINEAMKSVNASHYVINYNRTTKKKCVDCELTLKYWMISHRDITKKEETIWSSEECRCFGCTLVLLE